VRDVSAKVYNDRTRRAWLAVIVSMAFFTVLFWLIVATRLAAFEPVVEGSGEGFATAVAVLYFVSSLVGAPIAVHTIGQIVESRTSKWKRDDAVVAFAGLGVVLALTPVLILAASEPEGAAIGPAIWLFGVPIVIATAFTRFFLEDVMRSVRLTRAATAVALIPPVVVILYLLGLYVAHGSGGVA
jgi:hypothetical protein